MSKATKKSIRYGLCAALLIALAMWTRWASRTDFHDHGWNYLRSGIYVFLFGAWGLSIRFRIVQTHVRRYLLMIAALMMLWLLLRSVKFSIDNVDAERLLWYCYYLPMLFIPMLSMFVSLSLGKAEDFRLPRWTKLLYLPTTLLLLLVLTNDLHQFVFFFPSGVMSDQDYRYKAGYFLVVMWEFFCAVVSITMILRNCRIPHSRRFRWLPLVPLVMSVGYAVAYVRGTHWVWVIAGDMTVTLCLIFASIFESCIQCGLIQSNLGYDELFEATSRVSKLESQLQSLQEEQLLLQSKYEGKIDLAAIEQRASELGLRKPSQEQIVYVNLTGTDQAEIYTTEKSSILGEMIGAIEQSISDLIAYLHPAAA